MKEKLIAITLFLFVGMLMYVSIKYPRSHPIYFEGYPPIYSPYPTYGELQWKK